MTDKYNLSNAKFGGGFSGDGGTTIGGTLNNYSSRETAKTVEDNNSTVKTILILASG